MKWARRHPTAAALIALTAAAVVGAAAAGSSTTPRCAAARRERRRGRARTTGSRRSARRSTRTSSRARPRWPRSAGTRRGRALSNVLTRLKNEPRLKARGDRAADLLARADRGGGRRRWRAKADRERLREFLRLRDEALFHETQFTGLDLPANLDLTRRSRRRGAGRLRRAESTRGWSLAALPASLTRGRAGRPSARGATSCCWSWPRPRTAPRTASRPSTGRPGSTPTPTRAYHLRRAACLARLGDQAGAAGELKQADAAAAGDRVRPLPDRPGAVQAARLRRGPPPLRRRPAAPARPLLGPRPGGDLLAPAPAAPPRPRPS